VVLRMDGPWVYGALVYNVQSFAGDDDQGDVNQMLSGNPIGWLPGGAVTGSVSFPPLVGPITLHVGDEEMDRDRGRARCVRGR